jgi:hypothetical protein
MQAKEDCSWQGVTLWHLFYEDNARAPSCREQSNRTVRIDLNEVFKNINPEGL